jgi:carboxypeptidase Q
MRKFITALFLFFSVLTVSAQEKLDMDMINKIKTEGTANSKVMDIAFHLTDANGPRLSGSPGLKKASNWAKDEMAKWGLANANLEPWGEFGKGWELQKSYVAMTAPYYKPLIAFPKTWTKGTKGLKHANVLLIKAKDSVELETYRSRMKGSVIVIYRTDTLKQTFEADAKRYTDDELNTMANAAMQQPRQRPAESDTAAQRRFREQAAARRNANPQPQIVGLNYVRDMATKEGAIAIVSMSPRGHDGTMFVQGGGAYDVKSPENFLDIMLSMEDYMMLCRLADADYPVSLDVDVQTAFNTKDIQGYNVVAEIPGTDPALKDEVVMLGGHLDSWQSAMGATDNAAGCSVMMEAVRILTSLGVKPRRTIRIALWSGEEQGLLGSRGYVKNHFADPATMELKPEHAKFSSYFNIDNGTGKIRGIYLQGNDKVKDIFTQWLAPFNDMGAKTITISNTGGTDHQSFDAVGLPGFQFIQDPIEYNTRTHHTNMDSYDHLIAADLQQIAVIVASFVYDAAMRDEKLPRKELPKPRTAGGRNF